MSKKETMTKPSDNHEKEKLDFQGKTDEELKEIAKTLETQLQQFQTMAVKAQGALEVIMQLLPEEDRVEG
tara:strand:+ start:170 stop:379 length:210 start_codon:yes stop_codon:yes gene_type:complete